MFDKLQGIEDKYNEITQELSNPEVIADQERFQRLAKTHSDLSEIVAKFGEYKQVQQGIAEAEEIMATETDPEFRAIAEQEKAELTEKLEQLERQLQILLLPKDPNDEKNVILEIRAGAGGEEAALFAGDLFRMYSRFAESQGWKIEIMDANPTELGGFKEVIAMIKGKGAYSRLKYESGVHRVQRIPTTESGGRIHTSTVTVAVLPEAEEVDVEINPNDLRIDVYRSSGHGGQSVNTTDSAVRITHLPSGLVVTCQDEKSQLKNKEKALRILRARLLDLAIQQQQAELAANRKGQVGTGDRSERIRTYNFPQGRVTDHRIGLTIYQLENFLNGEIGEMINALATADQAEKLKDLET
ncbi:MAG: peptide chain release factor 1 [Firmicutes bacterium]|nr:peptide chain release factor 1 [Bacillota bacterium]